MGFWADRKAKKAFKSELSDYEYQHAKWAGDIEIFNKIKGAFESAIKGEDAVSNLAVQKPGEIVIWSGRGQFHEAGRTPGQYVGSSQGLSIPVVAGIRYRVGAMRGTFVPGDAIQAYKEVGDVILSTDRIMFNGMYNTKEWAFAKWNGAATSNDESDYIFNVSNRQKTSGILFDVSVGREFNRFLAQAIDAAENGLDSVITTVDKVLKDLAGDEPVKPELVLPSAIAAPPVTPA
ncbi:MAG: hypothetical protein NTZ91_01695 [Actinobacteria bacterium]|nr:hypothetical protein [Actinomycetota bacterium]